MLMDSVHLHNPNDKLFIGLVDELSPLIDYSFFLPAEIVPLRTIGIPGFEDLCSKYDLVELNTSVKASFFKFLIQSYPDAEGIIYFDPDIKLFAPLKDLYQKLRNAEILLTPHINSPISRDQYSPQEHVFLNYGLYNLGFLAINTNSSEAMKFIEWWEDRILNLGFKRVSEGLFVDQLWINLVPIFFKNVYILKEFGYNMAPWNLHERSLLNNDGQYFLNDASQLVFYHFSAYDYKMPDQLCKPYYTRFSLSERFDIQPLYRQYHDEIITNRIQFFSRIECSLLRKEIEPIVVESKVLFPEILKSYLRLFIPPVLFRVRKFLTEL